MRPLRSVVRGMGLGVGILVVAASVASGQSVLSLAEGRSAVIPDKHGFVSLDFKESAIGLRLYRDSVIEFDPGESEVEAVCERDWARIKDHEERTFDLSLAAEKGKRALFKGGSFTPGADVQIGYARFWELGFDPPSKCPEKDKAGEIDLGGHGYHAFFIGLRGGVTGRDTVAFPTGLPAVLADETGWTTGLTIAYNRRFHGSRLLALSASLGREWRSPGDDSPLQACVVESSGVDADGKPVRLEDCSDRYAKLTDFTSGELRVEFAAKIREAGEGPHVGVLLAASTKFRQEMSTTVDLAMGPTLHPKDEPTKMLGAALLEVRDLADASGSHPRFKDRLSLRLYATLPF